MTLTEHATLAASVSAVILSPDPIPAAPPSLPGPRAFRILNNDEGKAVKAGGQVFAFSPSQVDTFRLCARKWGFGAIDRIYMPGNASAALGSRAHELWEDYLKTGKMPSATVGKDAVGKIAEATLKFLPLPGVAHVEGETFVLIEDHAGNLIVMTCRIDFTIDDQGRFSLDQLGEMPPGWSVEEHPFEGVPLIGDHKSTSSFDYAKQPEDLIGNGTRDQPGDAQATCYGLVAVLKSPNAPAVDLFWSYSRTKGAKAALPIRARMSLTDLDRSLSFLWQDVDAMRRFKQTAQRANDLPANANGCNAFGGCPHRQRCELTNEEKINAMSSSLAALLGVTTAAPAVASPTPAAIAPAAPAAPAGGGLGALLGMGGAAPAAAPLPMPVAPVIAPTVAAVLPPVVVAPVVQPAVDLVAVAKHFFSAGQPPDAAQCGAHYAGVVAEFNKLVAAAQPLPVDAPTPAQSAAIVQAAAPAAPAAIVQPQATTVSEPTVAAETPAAPKAKRGRKPKADESVDESDPIALLRAALEAASDKGAFRLVGAIANVLASNSEQTA